MKNRFKKVRFYNSYQFFGLVTIAVTLAIFYFTEDKYWLGLATGSLIWLRRFY